MDFSGLEAQVFIGVAVILGCAFVALLCDYLKGVNERLRERSLELTVRLEEADRWRQSPALQLPVVHESPTEVLGEISRLQREVERVSANVASIAQLQAALATASTPRGADVADPEPREEPEEHWEPPSVFEPRREYVEAEPERTAPLSSAHMTGWAMEADSGFAPDAAESAVEESAPQPVAASPSQTVALPGPAEAAFEEPPVQPAIQAPVPPPLAAPARDAESDGMVIIKPEVTPALASILRVPPRPTPAASLQELMINVGPRADAPTQIESPGDIQVDIPEPARPNAVKIRVVRNESVLLDPVLVEPASARVAPPAPAAEEPRAVASEPALPAETMGDIASEMLPAVPGAAGEMSLPSGMHDRATLDFLRADRTPFTGLVVAIGINDFTQLRESAGAEAADDLVRNITQLVKSITSNLVGPQHFAARASDDEFILVFNGEIGPVAQRRMAAVSERLWDFQLRSIGTFSVVFSWGAAEASEELFADAVENAAERMRETRQNRKAMGGEKGRKRVVA